MRSQKLIVLGFLLGGAFLLNPTAKASTYHSGTPKALRDAGIWGNSPIWNIGQDIPV